MKEIIVIVDGCEYVCKKPGGDSVRRNKESWDIFAKLVRYVIGNPNQMYQWEMEKAQKALINLANKIPLSKRRWIIETRNIYVRRYDFNKKSAHECAKVMAETYYDLDDYYSPLDAVLEDFSYA